jgi:hypothetical protein
MTEDQEILGALRRGRQTWIDSNPSIVAAVNARCSPDMANAIGVEHSDLIDDEIGREIDAAARAKGLDVNLMLLRMGAGSESEFQRLRAMDEERTNRILGL